MSPGWRTAILVLLLLVAAVYALGWTRRARGAWRRIPPWRAALALGGLASLVAALASPLQGLAHHRFSAHMIQHVLLVAVAAPALLLADPFATVLWALPSGVRFRVGRLLVRGAPLRRAWRALTWMPVAWLAHALTLWTWHLPAVYDAALAHWFLHDVEHLAFFASATLFWWPVIDPAPRAGGPVHPGRQIVYLVLGAFQSAALGLAVALAPTPLYAAYAGPGTSPLEALEDQARGGVIMWAVGTAVDTLAVMLVLFRFLGVDEHGATRSVP